MRSTLHRILIVSALCAVAPSCASRVETRLAFPPAADLKTDPEPAYPEAALQPGAAGEAAEREWWNAILIWGRGDHSRIVRICNWAKALKMPDAPC